ncbi:MAG: lytic murein transglycosylase [Wenzhouxiangellaceae bacterium]|nr:lytic murein transglycosylase [Wenzhouxiangellaceae bacterium]
MPKPFSDFRKRSIRKWSNGVVAGLAFCLLSSGFAGAEPADSAEAFPACLADLQSQARLQGVSESLVGDTLARVQFQPRVIELDRAQPEFRQSFSAYLEARVNAQRVARGRELLAANRDLLAGLTARTGVPGHYLVALWGLETNFGGYLGNMPTLDSLATLACDPRRASFFTTQLMTALKLMERESLSAETMRGSWAGAVGHTQFMPTSYYDYAVDGDADGRIDLWNSPADALASGANYLHKLGWKAGQRWGREVQLPADFDFSDSGASANRPLQEWRQRDVRRANGDRLPIADMQAAVVVPMGHRGPAFLVYENFEVLMGWNRSQSYAIAAGHLADRIAGAGGLVAVLPDIDRAPSASDVSRLQRLLAQLGFDPGEPDGIIGPASRAALRQFQQSKGLVADGYPDEAVFEMLEQEPVE